MALFSACGKMEMPTDESLVAVSFNTTIEGGIPMTKSLSENEIVREGLARAIPPYVNLVLRKKSNGNEIGMKSNDIRQIPKGEYEVELYIKPCGEECGYCYNDAQGTWANWGDYGCSQPNYIQNKRIYFKYPLFSMDKFSINIDNDCTIPIKLKYDCSAVVFDNTKCSTVNQQAEHAFCVFCTFNYESISILFIRNLSATVQMTMTPKDSETDLEPRTYNFNAQNLEKGKYYWLRCYECGKSEIGVGFDTEEWSEGTI